MIKIAQLIFFEKDHIYELNGEQLPSVSELTRFISREVYGDVAQFRLDNAAERGTKVHKLTEALDKYGAQMQETICIEELSELQKALCKNIRGKGSMEDISEEIADVQIMLAQMILLFNLESEVKKWRNTKLERLRDRLSEVTE